MKEFLMVSLVNLMEKIRSCPQLEVRWEWTRSFTGLGDCYGFSDPPSLLIISYHNFSYPRSSPFPVGVELGVKGLFPLVLPEDPPLAGT